MRIILLILLSTLLVFSAIDAQVVQTPSGPLEFIGLESWSPDSLWSAIYGSAPGEGAHACAAVLKEGFHFADASVLAYPLGDTAIYWVVTVIEPDDSSRVRYRSRPVESRATSTEWAPFVSSFRSGSNLVAIALSCYPLVAHGEPDSARARAEEIIESMSQYGQQPPAIGDVTRIWDILSAHRSTAAKARDLETLQEDRNDTNRACAAAMLINFPDDDAVWCALMDAQIDSSIYVQVTAAQVLEALTGSVSRTVDWRAATGSIRLILNGTNLFAFAPTIATLTATNVSPDLAGSLLKENHDLLLAMVDAVQKDERERAVSLLKQLSGNDYGFDREKWRRWMDLLP